MNVCLRLPFSMFRGEESRYSSKSGYRGPMTQMARTAISSMAFNNSGGPVIDTIHLFTHFRITICTLSTNIHSIRRH